MKLRHRRSAALAAALLAVLALAGPVAADTVTQSLTINVSGLTGQYADYGIITDNFGRHCTSTCTFTYAAGLDIKLSVVPAGPAQIVQLGSCGAVNTCTVFSDQPHTVDAVFSPVTTQVLRLASEWEDSMWKMPPDLFARHDGSIISTVMPPCHTPTESFMAIECKVSVPTFSTVTVATTTGDPSVRLYNFDSLIPCIGSWQVCTFVMNGPGAVSAMFQINTLEVPVYCAANEWASEPRCGSPTTALVLTSPSLGTQRSAITGCFDPDYPCGGALVEVPFGETVHTSIEVPDGIQPRFFGPCAADVLECDVVVRAPTEVGYTLHDGRPDTPTGLRLVAGDQSLTAAWNRSDPPGSGGPATYTVTAEPGHHVVTTTSLSVTIPGLTNDTTYSVSVVASNAYGATGATPAVFGTPVPAPTDYTISWSAADAARIDEIAAYLGTDASGVQRQAVYLTAFLIGLDPTAAPEPTSLPPAADDIEVTSSWARAELMIPESVQRRFVLDGVDAHRFSVYLLSYLLSLTGH